MADSAFVHFLAKGPGRKTKSVTAESVVSEALQRIRDGGAGADITVSSAAPFTSTPAKAAPPPRRTLKDEE